MEDDKRSTPRHRLLSSDHFLRRGVMSCIVRNLSVSGASLELAFPIRIPASIVLNWKEAAAHGK